MELIIGLGILALGAVLLVAMLKAGFWILFAVALPLLWLFMLIDAVLRRDAEYPSRGSTEKIVWIVLMVFLQPSAIAYYLLVFRKIRRGQSLVAAPAHYGAPQPAATAGESAPQHI